MPAPSKATAVAAWGRSSAPALTVQNCTVQNNSATGVQFYSGSSLVYKNNTSFNNYNRLRSKDRVDFYLAGYASSVSRDLLIKSMATNVTIGTNLVK